MLIAWYKINLFNKKLSFNSHHIDIQCQNIQKKISFSSLMNVFVSLQFNIHWFHSSMPRDKRKIKKVINNILGHAEMKTKWRKNKQQKIISAQNRERKKSTIMSFRWHNWNQFNSHNNKREWKLMSQNYGILWSC